MTRGRPDVANEQNVAVTSRSLALQLFAYWGTVLSWMALIAWLSSDAFSAENTGRYLDPILRFFVPHLTSAQFAVAHWVIRKSAHFGEFFVLGCLLYWAVRRGRTPRWRAAWMWQALGLAIAYSVLDEVHQGFVPSRTSSFVDSGIDSLGAVSSQLLIGVRYILAPRLISPH